jgi:hypothetical protein
MHDVMDCLVEILQLIKPYRPFAIITLLLVLFTLKYPLSASVHVYGIILYMHRACMGVSALTSGIHFVCFTLIILSASVKNCNLEYFVRR